VVDHGVPGHVRDERAQRPDWDVRALINHMAISLLFAAAIVRNQPPPTGRLSTRDVLGPQFRDGFGYAAATARQAFSDPDALAGLCDSPAGAISGAAWINFPTWDIFVHGWDLSKAKRPSAACSPGSRAGQGASSICSSLSGSCR
jgi:uncharacterized protein (TIGR03086 family)